MDSFIRNVCRFLFVISLVGLSTGFVLSLFINTANAATTKPFKTSDIGRAELYKAWTTLEPSEIYVDFETTATTPQGQQVTRHTTRAVPINKARLGSLAKSAVGGPVAIAATAAFLAYDYFYDESTETWQVEPAKTLPDTPTGYCSVGGHGKTLSQCFTNTTNQLCSGANSVYCPLQTRAGSGNKLDISYSKSFVPNNTHWQPPSGYFPPSYLFDGFTPSPAIPATDADLGEAIKNAPAQTITDILNDPISTGTWRDRWPEMEPVVTDISDTIGYDIEGTPTENYDPTISDGSTATPKPVTQPSENTTATEWPTFCSWATVVCDFIDWFKEEPTPPETPDLPITEVNPVEWESGLGAGSCPTNLVVEMMNAPLEYDFAIPCWGASNVFQPILIFLSLIGAAYIIIGAKN